jgi:hypothetical protein
MLTRNTALREGIQCRRLADDRATVLGAIGFRWAIGGEAGLMHNEGRQYVGLVRHLVQMVQSLVVLGFVSVRTDRLRGKTRV